MATEPTGESFFWFADDGARLFARFWPAPKDASTSSSTSLTLAPTHKPNLTPTPLVILVHGLGEHAARYQQVADALCRSGCDVYIFDLRGHGQSDGKRGDTPSFQRLVLDLDQFFSLVAARSSTKRLDWSQRSREERPLLVAHSMGGIIAAHFAWQFPHSVQRLVLISPYFRAAFTPKWWRLALGKIFYRWWPSFSLNVGLKLKHLAKDDAIRKSITHDPLMHQRLSARWAIEAIDAGERLLAMTERFPVEADILHGDQDRVTSFAAVQEWVARQNSLGPLPPIRFIPIPGGYHQIHNDAESREWVIQTIAGVQK